MGVNEGVDEGDCLVPRVCGVDGSGGRVHDAKSYAGEGRGREGA